MAIPYTRADALQTTGMTLRSVGALRGIRVEQVAVRNGPGTGRLRTDGTKLSWKAPGSSTFGEVVNCDTDGDYLLEDGEDTNKCIRIQIFLDELPSGINEVCVYLRDTYWIGSALGNVSASEAENGEIDDSAFALYAASPVDLLDVKCWLDSDTEYLTISKDDIDYYAPDSEGHADVLAWAKIESGSTEYLYIKRTIPPSTTFDPFVLNQIHFAWTGY